MTLALLDNVWHGDTTNADDSVALTLGQGVLTLVQTVTDADGDSASAAVDLGANGVFRFEDDGRGRAGGRSAEPGATVDESLVSLGGVGTDGVASATLSAADVQAQFNPAFGPMGGQHWLQPGADRYQRGERPVCGRSSRGQRAGCRHRAQSGG
ncbi:DUF5801 repeats-in-toxin domain-containing protein [Aeromonas hydrophila]|uniref:DUF5801 repeats-in-toxin domain-containing protein n=1 Tax=Aeromonas hydrophila TaxID=644 RepID=UPI000FDA9283|nr:DUF5801 repeats-in-toxin domain-containing protein [Aeromonas hydrophila]